MYALSRFSCPSLFHPSTNRRMYKLLSKGLIGDPCGVPRPSFRFRVLRCVFPRSSVSSTGASSHILIRCSIAPSTTRRATDLRRSACGRLWLVGTSLGALALAEPCRAGPFGPLTSPSRHGTLCSSPHAEPGVQVSRTGLPRSRLTPLVRQSRDESRRTGARTTSDSGDSTSTADVAGCGGAILESSATALLAERRRGAL